MRIPIPALLAACALLGGCGVQQATLKPAPSANTVPAPGGISEAVAIVAGVRVAAAPLAWPGPTPIGREVTPLRLKIENRSDQPILVRYEEMALIGPGGRVYGALPPYSIDATVTEPRLTPGFPVMRTPGFSGSGFAVAPMYSPMYPGYPVAGGSFIYDAKYYGWYGSHWRRVALPTPEMLRLALPEGKLAPGGSVDGFIYLEQVDPAVPRVRFRMDIVNAQSGQTMGTVEIPFVVASS